MKSRKTLKDKMRRMRSDNRRRAFLRGVGSVVVLAPSSPDVKVRDSSEDRESLGSDSLEIASDFRAATEKVSDGQEVQSKK